MERIFEIPWTKRFSINFSLAMCFAVFGQYSSGFLGVLSVSIGVDRDHSHNQNQNTNGNSILYQQLEAFHNEHNISYNDVATGMEVGEGGVAVEATHQINRGPFFDVTASRNVTALVGKTAYLNCRVHNLNNKTVSWIRHRDIHLLTVGKFTYTSDLRFQSIHNPQTEDWSLQVRYSQKRDSGIYECQVSTTPPIGHSMYLSIVEPITTLVGAPDLYINTGSTVNLTCIVQHSPEPPPAIKWMHNNAEINYDSPRGGVSVITEKGEVTTSFLLIQRAKQSDSGKYTCSPSNANPVTVTVHILNGEHPAAMQRGEKLSQSHSLFIVSVLVIVAMLQTPR